MQPYSDEYMIYDERRRRYVLTEQALTELCAVDLRSRISETSTVNPETVINRLLVTVSDMVYQFIHEHNANNAAQDRLIATVPELRDIIREAMVYQAVYVMNVGNLYLSTDPTERAAAIDVLAQSILGNEVKGLGISVLYAGCLR